MEQSQRLAYFVRMTVHLIKLCVGAESVDDHRAWIAHTLQRKAAMGLPVEQFHTTRMFPKRKHEVLNGGSLYWVTKGVVQSRQRILDLRSVESPDGITRCEIVLEPKLILTRRQPRRPFQGWRYLKPEDAPEDLGLHDEDINALPPTDMRDELTELGLL